MQKKKRNTRLIKWLGKYHNYLGLIFGAFIILASITGIFLNHEDFFLSLGKTETLEPRATANQFEPLLQTGSLPSAAISFEQALALATQVYGEKIPLDRIELKDDNGQLIYKIRTHKQYGKKREIEINAFTGEAVLREEGAYLLKNVASPDQEELAGVDWPKLIEAIHTGEFYGGLWGKLLIDFCALVMIFLTGSGIYIWSTRRKRSSRRHRKPLAAFK